MKGVVEHFWGGKAGTAPKLERQPNGKINIIGGFDGYTVGNLREIKRILDLMGVEYTILGDNSDVWDTPTDGEFRMYDGGTTLEDAANAVHAKATISMQQYCTKRRCLTSRAGTRRRLPSITRLAWRPPTSS